MPKNRPTTGQTNWGDALNAHLNQLTPSGGGVNYGTTRPTLTASDDGYTMVDTSTREIIRWNGTGWEVLLGGFTEGKPQLTQDTDIFVNGSAGNDSNNGKTAGTAFKTFDRAVREAYNIDLSTFSLRIRVAPGTYTEIFAFNRPLVGSRNSYIQVIGSGSGNTVLQTNFDLYGSAGIITNASSSRIRVSGVKLQSTGSNGQFIRALLQSGPGTIAVGEDVNFGDFRSTPQSQHMFSDLGGVIFIEQGYTVSGGAVEHISTGTGGLITTYTLPGDFRTCNFSGSNIVFDRFASSTFGLITPDIRFTGSASATVRANADYNGVVLLRPTWPGTVDNQYNGGVVAG